MPVGSFSRRYSADRAGANEKTTLKKLILRNLLSPGDIVMLTAALRDLHKCYPREFVTDVRTSCPELWDHNPYLTPLDEADPSVEVIDCDYPLIGQSNQTRITACMASSIF